ncbi:hypothetical protein [uncultured Desulfovibrio sp.]|uniref:hypothetical protein n=1 Tax=uncultured Desulfovibrio sp. TaxID=167968 RepID=UPI002612EA61|nr:hypothetical protein [uncultured Desulfovibrio sp.]
MGDICGCRVWLWGVFALAGALLGLVASTSLFLRCFVQRGVGGAMFNTSGLAPAA